MSTIVRRHLEVLAGRDAQVAGGGLRRSRSSTPCRAASSASSGSSLMNSCRPLSTSSPFAIAALEQLAPGRREAAALGRDADERGRRVEAERVVDGRRRPGCRPSVSPARVESSTATTGSRRVADDAARRLPVVRVAARCPQRGLAGTRLRRDTETRVVRGESGRRRRARRPATGRPRAGGCRRGRRGRRGSRSGSRRRCRARTRPCSRASRRARARAPRAPSAPPRGSRRTSRA